MTLTCWLKYLLAAYRPAYLRGMLLDGLRRCVPRIRERVASECGTAAPLPPPPPRAHIATMSVPSTQLELKR